MFPGLTYLLGIAVRGHTRSTTGCLYTPYYTGERSLSRLRRSENQHHRLSRTQPKPRSEQPPPDQSGATSRYCKLATELRARAPEHWAVVLGS